MITPAVDGAEYLVKDRRYLNDLTIAAAYERGWLAMARLLKPPEEFDILGTGWDLEV